MAAMSLPMKVPACLAGAAMPGERFAVAGVAVAAQIPGDADLGMISDREVGLNDDATTTIHLATGGFGEFFAEMGGTHPAVQITVAA